MVWTSFRVDITPLSKEGQVLQFVPVEASGYVDSLTPDNDDLLTWVLISRVAERQYEKSRGMNCRCRV